MALQEEPRTAEEVPPPVGETTPLPSIALRIAAIRVIQPPESGQRQDLYVQGRALSGFVKGGEPLVFAVTFQLTGLGASEIANKHDKFSVFFNAEDLSTFVVSALGVSIADVLRDGQSTYTAWLSPLTLSPGLYRLKIVTTVRDVRPVSACADVPLLQVV